MRATLARGRPHPRNPLDYCNTRRATTSSIVACLHPCAVFPHDATALIRLGYRQFFRRIQIIWRRMHLWISSCNDEIHTIHYGHFSRMTANGSPLGTGRPTVAAREFPPRFPFDLSAYRAAPHRASCHAQLAAPACMTDSHRMSPTTCPVFGPDSAVIAARIHARVLCDFPIGNFMMLLPASIDLIGILIECQMHVNTVLIRME